ncbi:site-2 protease family protein [Patescibacteria group bacterium]|nr:site-2 protease family protein [Patescibacteria group bacterium]
METIIFSLIILIFSIVIHEVSHGAMADYLGDPTAKYAGRLTLNPIKHLDPFGSIILPILLLILTGGEGPIFGWARPVPINPYNFRDKKWGSLKVAIAGPGSNILVAIAFGSLIRFFPLPVQLLYLFSIIVILNLLLAIFNLVPIPPLDGSHILFSLLSEKYQKFKLFLQQYGFFILILFIFFGLQWIFPLVSLAYQVIVGRLPLFF